MEREEMHLFHGVTRKVCVSYGILAMTCSVAERSQFMSFGENKDTYWNEKKSFTHDILLSRTGHIFTTQSYAKRVQVIPKCTLYLY